MLVAEAEHHGTIESDERRMIAGVMRLGDRAVRAVMTPRTEIDWLNLEWDEAAARKMLMETQHSRLPVGEGVVDNMIGVVQTRDLLAAMLAGQGFDPRKHVRPAPIVHDQADALDVLTTLKESEVPVALVHDEYGHFEGIVTPADILEAITGVFRSDLDEEDEPPAVKREDGSWLLAGYMQADEMAEHLGIDLPENRDYETVAGYILSHLHRLPATGECVDAQGWRFEVVDLDGRRIDKVIASRLPGVHRAQAKNAESGSDSCERIRGGLRHPVAVLGRRVRSSEQCYAALASAWPASAARAVFQHLRPPGELVEQRLPRPGSGARTPRASCPAAAPATKSPQTMCTALRGSAPSAARPHAGAAARSHAPRRRRHSRRRRSACGSIPCRRSRARSSAPPSGRGCIRPR